MISIYISAVFTYLLTHISYLSRNTRKKDVELCDSKRILILRFDGIGDITMTSPMLRELRKNCPSAEITLIIPHKFKNLMETCPYVDHVMGFNCSAKIRPRQLSIFFKVILYNFKYLKNENFDYVIVPRTGSSKGELYFALLSNSSNQVIYDSLLTVGQVRKINGIHHLFTNVLQADLSQHEVESNLRLLELMGLVVKSSHLELWPSCEDRKAIDAILDDNNIYIAIGCNVTELKRSWPTHNYINLIKELLKINNNFKFLIHGGMLDLKNGDVIKEATGDYVINLAGKLSIRETCESLGKCSLYVGNDSGPMHLAVAMGVPVVEISCHPIGDDKCHVNAPERFGPYGVDCEICRPKEKSVQNKKYKIEDIKTSNVLTSTKKMISKYI